MEERLILLQVTLLPLSRLRSLLSRHLVVYLVDLVDGLAHIFLLDLQLILIDFLSQFYLGLRHGFLVLGTILYEPWVIPTWRVCLGEFKEII